MLCLLSICILHSRHQEASDALSTDRASETTPFLKNQTSNQTEMIYLTDEAKEHHGQK